PPRPLARASSPTRRSSDLGMRDGGIEKLVLLSRDRERAVDLAGYLPAVDHLPGHVWPPFSCGLRPQFVDVVEVGGRDHVRDGEPDRKSKRLNYSHVSISYA